MTTFLSCLALLFLGALQLVYADVDFNLASFKNVIALHTVDIVNTYLLESVELQIQNTGSDTASSYVLVVPEERAAHLSLIRATDSRGNVLGVSKIGGHSLTGLDLYDINFEYPLDSGSELSLSVKLAYNRGTYPYPAEAKQSDSQWLLYEGSVNYISLYETARQETRFTIITDKYEILEGPDGTIDESTGFLGFGPYEDIKPLERLPLSLRFENPLPMPFIENLNRTIWVSHWGGSVSFDESYDLHNVGTKVSSAFSRLDYSKPKVGFSLNNAAIRALRFELPSSHREEYYVDLVGNVSTSAVAENTLEILPRYPVMGGWFYNFTVGWASDLKDFVRETTFSQYILAVPLVGGPEKASYGTVASKIVLPEGASNIEVFSEVPAKSQGVSVTYSYLDLYGRPTIELGYSNLVSQHKNARIFVTYYYSPLTALRKPFSYTIAIALGLFAIKSAIKLL